MSDGNIPNTHGNAQKIADSVLLLATARIVTVLGPIIFSAISWWIYNGISEARDGINDANRNIAVLSATVSIQHDDTVKSISGLRGWLQTLSDKVYGKNPPDNVQPQ